MKNLNFSVKKNLATHAICAGNLASFSDVDVISIERTFEQLVPPHNQEGLNILGSFGSKYPAWLSATTCLYSVKYLQLMTSRHTHTHANCHPLLGNRWNRGINCGWLLVFLCSYIRMLQWADFSVGTRHASSLFVSRNCNNPSSRWAPTTRGSSSIDHE